jgi:hypothetical protein
LLSDLLHWSPLVISGAIIWAGYQNIKIVHAANMDRRDDHREMMDKLQDIDDALGRLDLMVDGIASAVEPPPRDIDDIFGGLRKAPDDA